MNVREPVLIKVAAGWMAKHDVRGDRWAVIAPTQVEAIQKFYDRRDKHREIDARSPK